MGVGVFLGGERRAQLLILMVCGDVKVLDYKTAIMPANHRLT